MHRGATHLVLVALVALALAFGGCGGNGDGETVTSSQDAQAESGGEEGGGESPRGGEASIEDFGAEAKGPERELILAAFEGSLTAVAEGDYAAACSYLTESVKSSLEELAPSGLKGRGCPALLRRLLAPTASQIAREQANGKVTKVRVEDDRAFVVFRAPGAELYQLTMQREGDEWKATTLAAAVLVPEL